MSETPRYRNIELSEMAKKVGMDEKEFNSRLHVDGYLSGGTQSFYARKLRLFEVEQSAPRWTGGLYHAGRFHIRITPKGVQLFTRLYGKGNRMS